MTEMSGSGEEIDDGLREVGVCESADVVSRDDPKRRVWNSFGK